MWWVPVTLVAAALQTARNATQAGLVAELGTLGATQVRFLYGLPFAVLFLGLAALVVGPVPALTLPALGFATLGALAQIVATALMLAAMRARGFAAATALVKTEPVLLALIGWAVLAEAPGLWQALAILTATLGTLLLSLAPGQRLPLGGALLALAAALGFGVAAVGFRGAILALPEGGALIRASTILVLSLAIQSVTLGAWLWRVQPSALGGSLRVWRASLAAGALGAGASQFWFLGFALTSAANVRTLALVEIVMARIVAGRVFSERGGAREGLGLALIALGVAWLLLAG